MTDELRLLHVKCKQLGMFGGKNCRVYDDRGKLLFEVDSISLKELKF